jgi:peptidoglycan-N-acetylglucosamine deacetylase
VPYRGLMTPSRPGGPGSAVRTVLSRARRRLETRLTDLPRSLAVPGKSVAITFDDGPDPVFTPPVLDVLAKHGVRATFFVVGSRARLYPDLVRRIVADGHGLGSHSEGHPDPWTLSLVELMREYRTGRRSVEVAANRQVRLFRPPKGYVDLRGAMAMSGARLRPWLWTCDPEDWSPTASCASIVEGLGSLTAGDVVLLHDGIEGPLEPAAEDRSVTLLALPLIIDSIRSKGLSFTALPG